MADKDYRLDGDANNGSTPAAIVIDGIGFTLEGEPPVCTHRLQILGIGH